MTPGLHGVRANKACARSAAESNIRIGNMAALNIKAADLDSTIMSIQPATVQELPSLAVECFERWNWRLPSLPFGHCPLWTVIERTLLGIWNPPALSMQIDL